VVHTYTHILIHTHTTRCRSQLTKAEWHMKMTLYHGVAVAQVLALPPHSKKVMGSIPAWGAAGSGGQVLPRPPVLRWAISATSACVCVCPVSPPNICTCVLLCVCVCACVC